MNKTVATETPKANKIDKARHALAAALQEKYNDTGSIQRTGEKIVIPPRMDLMEAARNIAEFHKSQEEETASQSKFKCHPNDGLVCLHRAITDIYGSLVGEESKSMFGMNPGQSVEIPIGFDETVTVPVGNAAIPGLPIQLNIIPNKNSQSETEGELVVQYTYPRKYAPLVDEINKATRTKLKNESIFKGKAIDSAFAFLDLSKFKPEMVIYSEAIRRQIDANIMAPIKKAAVWEKSGAKPKRGILLSGPYGTGKTLTALLTAWECVEHGVTFISVKPKGNISTALRVAKLYEPAVVFFEDIDQETAGDRTDNLNEILNTVDGMVGKNERIITILTTNHPENITPAMLRPGRLDSIIFMGDLDADAVLNMVTYLSKNKEGVGQLSGELDKAELYAHAVGYTAAFVSEAVTKAKAYAIARDDKEIILTERDLCDALDELRPQFEMMMGAKAPTTVTLHTIMEEMVKKSMDDVLEGTWEEVMQKISDAVRDNS